MTVTTSQTRVLIAGGGIAALELLLALRALAGRRVAVTLLADAARHAPRAMTVAEPFERGGARMHDCSQIARDQDARLVLDKLVAVDTPGNDPQPFRPVLRGRVLTSGAPLYLQSRPSGQSVASARALWSPPAKVAGRYLAPYLATARPSLVETLTELVPALPAAADAGHDAVTRSVGRRRRARLPEPDTRPAGPRGRTCARSRRTGHT